MSGRVHSAALVLYWFLVYSPLAALLLSLPGASFPGLRLSLLLRSAALSAGVAIASGGIGLVAAIGCRRRRRPLRWLPWLALGMAVMPSFVHTLVWAPVLARLERGLAIPGWAAAGWVETMVFLPLSFCISLLALSAPDPRLVDSARLSRPAFAVLLRVVLPLAAPAWLAGVSLIFVLSLADYTVPSLFTTATYALGIFADFSAGTRPGTTLLLAAPLLAVSASVLVLIHAPLRRAALQRNRVDARLAGSMPKAWVLLEAAAGGLCAAGTALILFGLLRAIAAPSTVVQAAVSSARSIGSSLAVAGAAAVIAVVPALAAARALVRPGRRTPLLWLAVLMPLGIPAPLTGIGLVTLWNGLAGGLVYGSDVMPVLAALARFLPIAAMLLAAFLFRLDPQLEDAARLFRRHWFAGLVRVTLPLLRPGLLASAGLVFALTLGEVGSTLVVAPPGMAMLSIRIYNYLHYGASGPVASLCLISAAATLAGALLVARMVRP